MSQRCTHCANLSIETLITLAEKEFSGHDPPEREYYKHYGSFRELEHSANSGCDLCLLIEDSFKATPENTSYSTPWDQPDTQSEIDQSLYAAAIKAENSEIKLSINSSHVYSSELLDKVQLFDLIFVQVGPSRLSLIDADDDRLESGLIPVELLIKTSRGCSENPCRVGGHRVGRFQTETDLGGEKNFAIARSWLQTCVNDHPKCGTGEMPLLPTRVIDVGRAGASFNNPRLVLSRGARGRYVALSHCWGNSLPLRLTQETINALQNGIPLDHLTKNFRDAVTITRELQVQYLWIDCLCILQDSQQDWAIESSNMGQVYRQAIMTIYASASSNSEGGILNKGLENRGRSSAALAAFSNDRRDVEVRIERRAANEESMRIVGIYGPLHKRGWTLQEMILSPRQLYYGRQSIYWRCREQVRSLDDVPAGTLFPETDTFEAMSSIYFQQALSDHGSNNDAVDDALKGFYWLVMDYSSRSLTRDADKLPALSGLCERLHQHIPGEYLAGLWSCDIPNGLLWYKEMRHCRHVEPYRAPSWSWAVTNDSVLYDETSEEKGIYELQVIDHDIKLSEPLNPYGAVTSGTLVVRGRTMPLVRSHQKVDLLHHEVDDGAVYFDEPELEDEESQAKLYFIQTEDGEHCCMSLPFTLTKQVVADVDRGFWSAQRYIAMLVYMEAGSKGATGIVLRPNATTSEATFSRVGVFKIYDTVEIHRGWESMTVTLI